MMMEQLRRQNDKEKNLSKVLGAQNTILHLKKSFKQVNKQKTKLLKM